MLNIDLEPLKKLYEEILNTQALSEKELKELETLINKLNETKKEFENSSFTLLEKNTELFNKSNNILQKINNMSNILYRLEDSLKKEKITFDNEIKQKFNLLLQNLKNSINSFNLEIMNKKNEIERNSREIVKNVENALKDTKKIILRENDEIEKIRKQYEKKLEKSLNSFKEKIDEYQDEIKQKTLLQRWGAVFIGIGLGILLGAGLMFVKFKDDIIFSLKYSSTCKINKKNEKCYIVPLKNLFNSNNKNYFYIIKK